MITIPCRWTEMPSGAIPIFNKTVDVPALALYDNGIMEQKKNDHGFLMFMTVTATSLEDMKTKILDLLGILFQQGVELGYNTGSFIGFFKEFWEENGELTNVIGIGYVVEETDWGDMPTDWCIMHGLPTEWIQE